MQEQRQPGARRGVTGCRAARKEGRELLAAIEAAGGVVEPHRSKTGHFKVYLDGNYIGGIAGTASDWRTRANEVSRLRRGGLNLTSKGRYEP